MRSVYDRFLAKFPLLFGYWKKYADLEFSITGTEAADMVESLGLQLRYDRSLNGYRSTNEASRAFPPRSTSGQITALSKPKPPTTLM